jgi:hypothetical protein
MRGAMTPYLKPFHVAPHRRCPLAPAVLLLWLLDVLDEAAQRTLLKQHKPYPRLRDGAKVEWK